LEQDAARLVRKLVEHRLDKGLYQLRSLGLPQVPAAFHELHFGGVAAGSQQRLDSVDGESEASLQLFVYIIPVEHCTLLAESDRFGPGRTAPTTAPPNQSSRAPRFHRGGTSLRCEFHELRPCN